MPCRTRGFTLIELLVVVSIIAVLAAMSLEAVTVVKRAVDSTRCANNLRTIGTAHLVYIDDQEGLFPLGSDWRTVYAPTTSTGPKLDPDYMSTSSALFCREAALLHPLPDPPATQYRMTYGHNASVLNKTLSKSPTISRVPKRSTKVYLLDTIWDDPSSSYAFWVAAASLAGEQPRHGARNNIWFLDGHVEALTPADTSF